MEFFVSTIPRLTREFSYEVWANENKEVGLFDSHQSTEKGQFPDFKIPITFYKTLLHSLKPEESDMSLYIFTWRQIGNWYV